MITIYNTMSGKKEKFESKELGKVSMYVCGPTVYNYIHVGNARTFIAFDIIRRYLTWRGFNVTFVQNLTDVDDKIIAKAQEEGVEASEVAQRYSDAFIEDMRAAGVLDPDIRPRATEEIPEMIELVETLIQKGHAYEVDGDVYFAVNSYDDYGKLSHRNLEDMESGHRDLRGADDSTRDQRKRNSFDFALWKAAKPGEPSWDSPWGMGRPGWHIECSAMSKKYLGLPFDIHGGGADLVFPHHENEIAQSEAACGCTFATYWMHSGMLRINSEKMSKSLGNFKLLREVLETTKPEVLRMLILQTHYRSPLDFSDDRLVEADSALQRIENTVKNIEWLCKQAEDIPSPLDTRKIIKEAKELRNNFIYSMDDDFNTAGALGEIFAYINDLNTQLAEKTISLSDIPALKQAHAVIIELLSVFGIMLQGENEEESYPAEVVDLSKKLTGYTGSNPAQAVEVLLECRQDARSQKNWDLADMVRDGLAEIGLVVEDTPQGPRVSRS